jgi:hypothetical protein
MPTINLPIPLSGPLIMVLVGVSFPRQQALLDAGQPVPPLATGTFLIDTGASSTCVDPDLLEGLNLTATGIVGISTPSTAGNPHLCEQYDVSLFLPGNQVGGHLIQALPVITTYLKT